MSMRGIEQQRRLQSSTSKPEEEKTSVIRRIEGAVRRGHENILIKQRLEQEKEDKARRLENEVFESAAKSQRIHIVGSGNMASFVAASLSQIAEPPPVTLLLHQPHKFQAWDDEGQSIEFMREGVSQYCTGFNVEWTAMQFKPDRRQRHFTDFERAYGYVKKKDEWAISKLVVTTTSNFTMSALKPLRWRLGPGSTICFLDHSMAVSDKVNAEIFPNPATRPRYILGMSSHGLWDTTRQFGVLQKTRGEIILSAVPNGRAGNADATVGDDPDSVVSRMKYGWTESSTSFLKTLTRCETLAAAGIPYERMLEKQWERIAINSVINPLTVVFFCNYGKLLRNNAARRLMHDLLTETVQVAMNLPEIKNDPATQKTLCVERLEHVIFNLLRKLGDNLSNMLKDVRKGKMTDVNYWNGYVIRKGEEVGIECRIHKTIIDMVRAKQVMQGQETTGYIPFS